MSEVWALSIVAKIEGPPYLVESLRITKLNSEVATPR